jgi:hypothetical protein
MANVEETYKNAVSYLRSEIISLTTNTCDTIPSERELDSLELILENLTKNQNIVRKEYSKAVSFLNKYKS